MFDEKVPSGLKDLQQWFGGIIARPLAENGGIISRASSGVSIEEEAKKYIIPSPTLKPYERLQIYNQQYWWRLLNALQEAYPLLVRFFGYADFNHDLAIPFLQKHPPNSWSLNPLGDRLPHWIRSYYKGSDPLLVYEAALLDRSFYSLFFKSLLTPLQPTEKFELLLKEKLYLQPHVCLFFHSYDLFAWRAEFLKHCPDYWASCDYPQLKHEATYTILMRTRNGATAWRTITKGEHHLLKEIAKGISIDKLCEWLERQPRRIRLEAEKSLQTWFEEWAKRGILTAIPSNLP
jgi:hypothetical protein